MKKLIAAFLLAAPLAALASPMTNDDVIKLVQGGLGDATVIQAINGAQPAFDTSPDGLVRLKQGGVSDRVIQHILALRPGASPLAPSAPAACPDCGTILDIREINKPGAASGGGAVAGAVVGGLLGRSIGGRDHRTAGTVAGAAGGAVAGHMIEKKAREGRTFEVIVKFDDNRRVVYHLDSHPSWRPSDRVRLVNGVLQPL